MNLKKIGVAAAIAAGLGMSFNAFAQETVTVAGSTTVLPVMQKISEAYMHAHPEVTIELSGGGSGNGIKALVDGLTQIAMSSREIKSGEVTLAKSKNVEPNQITVAVDAIVPVVHPENPVGNLTVDQLRSIYKGEVKNWKELGGKDHPIVVVSRDTSSGTYESWEGLVMKKQRITPRALLQASNGAVVQTVAKNANAIGYVGIGYLGDSIQAVQVGGVTATAENVLADKWPLARELYLYTNGKPAAAVGKFVDYTVGAEGQKLVKEVGFIPLSK